jgi:hypothetical protein
MLSVSMLSVIMLSVIILSIVAPILIKLERFPSNIFYPSLMFARKVVETLLRGAIFVA